MAKKSNGASLIPMDGEEKTNWDDFHIPTRDPKGHCVNQQCKMSPALQGQINTVVKSKKYPYRGVGFLIRHAIIRHINWLKEHPEFEDGVGSTIHAIEGMIDVVREEDYMQDLRAVFESLSDSVREHQNRGNTDRAKQMIIKMYAKIKLMEDMFWRSEFEKELKSRFGNFLQD